MRCPFCSHEDTQVKDSRPSEDGMTIRRRRFCGACNSRFTTFERVQLRELTVVKRDGDRKPFDRDKVVRAIAIAVRKRPVNEEQVEQLASQIVHKLETSGDSEIASTAIGEMIMEGLKTLDKVAYIRFASVYRNFAEMRDFQEILGQLSTGKEAKVK